MGRAGIKQPSYRSVKRHISEPAVHRVVVFSESRCTASGASQSGLGDSLQPSSKSIPGKPARQKFRLPPRNTMRARRRAAGEVTEHERSRGAAPRKASGADAARNAGTRRRPSSGGRGRRAGGGGATEARAHPRGSAGGVGGRRGTERHSRARGRRDSGSRRAWRRTTRLISLDCTVYETLAL